MASSPSMVRPDVGQASKLNAPHVERSDRDQGDLSQGGVFDEEGQPLIADKESRNGSEGGRIHREEGPRNMAVVGDLAMDGGVDPVVVTWGQVDGCLGTLGEGLRIG